MKTEIKVATTVAAMMVTALISQDAFAKTLEDVLKEKGVITEADYKEVTRSKPVNYKIGSGFTFTSPDDKFQLSLGGRIQTRYTFTNLEDNSKATDSSKWANQRMRIWMKGYAYTKDLTYFLNTNFGTTESNKNILDAYLNYRFLDEVQIRVGQSKIPFGRQWLASSAAQQFVDRSFVSDAFRPGYDIGANLHGDIAKGLATYDLGTFGGTGWSTPRTTNNNAIAARLTVNPLGKMDYSESDMEKSQKPLLSVGANYFYDTLQSTFKTASGTTAASTTLETNIINFAGTSGWLGKGLSNFKTTEEINVNTYGIDAAFKWQGLSATGEYLMGEAKGDKSGTLLKAKGFYAQAGYFIIPQTLEAAFRYAYLDPNRSKSNDLKVETQGAVSWYFNKHNLKLQGDVTNSHDQSKGSTDDMIYRLQATVIF